MQPAYRSRRAAESLLTPPGGRLAPALAPKVLYCRQGLRQQCPAAPQTPPCPMQGHSTPLPPKPPQPLPPAGDPVHAQAWPWAPRLHLKLKASEWKPILQMQLRVWEEASPCISSRATLCPALLSQCPSGDCTVWWNPHPVGAHARLSLATLLWHPGQHTHRSAPLPSHQVCKVLPTSRSLP